jgi:hypothetical protein
VCRFDNTYSKTLEAVTDNALPEPDTDFEVGPVEDLFDFAQDPVDFMSAESFPASDPPAMRWTVPDLLEPLDKESP